MKINEENLKGIWVADRTSATGNQIIIREATVSDLVRYVKPEKKIPAGLVPPSFSPTPLWIVWLAVFSVCLKMLSLYWAFYIIVILFVLDMAGARDGMVGAWRRIATNRKRESGVIALALAPVVLFVHNPVFLIAMAFSAFVLFEVDRARMLHVLDKWRGHGNQARATAMVRDGKAVKQEGGVLSWRTWHEWFDKKESYD